ncbi:MAG TPA: hypothetical protein PKY88_12820 [Anaerohalosphaeraceae bacterium]|nr:hypothetical protein [Anaerohalosphaeraceae bacterium]
MKQVKIALILTLVFAVTSASQASLLVYEGFGDATGGSLGGYSGSSAESGLAGSWSVSPGRTTEYLTSIWPYQQVGIDGGYEPDTVGGRQHWWECKQWNVVTATRPLANPIDLTTDKTLYMSFSTISNSSDIVVQVGLSNTTHELMAGNAYGWNNRGLTAYYATNGTDPATGGADIYPTYPGGVFSTGLYVIKLVKTNSGTTNNLAVYIKFYNLGDLPPFIVPLSIGISSVK